MTRISKGLALAAAVIAVSAFGGDAVADYPEKPITLVVPFPAGGAADFIGRLYADGLASELDATVVVENRPGASGTVGATIVAKAAPDGYTLVLGSVSSHATSKTMMEGSLAYDPEADFTPISLVAMVPTVLVASAAADINSVEELVAYGKAHPGELNYGSVGNGTSQHLAGAMFANETGVDMVHIPYRGQNTLVPDLVAGKVHIIFNNVTSTRGQIEAGEIVPLAVALPERWHAYPDTPTFTEVGLPAMKVSSWTGVFAPAGLDPAIQKTLSDASQAAIADEDRRGKLLAAGNQPVGGTAEELAEFVAGEVAYWREVITVAGVKP